MQSARRLRLARPRLKRLTPTLGCRPRRARSVVLVALRTTWCSASTPSCATSPSSDTSATGSSRSAPSCANTSSPTTTKSGPSAATSGAGSTPRRSWKTTTSASARTTSSSRRPTTRSSSTRVPAAVAASRRAGLRPAASDCLRQGARRSTRRAPRAFRPASVVNISAMSYGSLSGAAVRPLNRGATLAGCLQNTGEGGLSPHHLHGGDLIFQIGTGYFGCRELDGRFSLPRLEELVARASADPRHRDQAQSGRQARHRRRAAARRKITPEIAAIRGVPADRDCISPAGTHGVPRRRLAARLRRAGRDGDRAAGRHQVGSRRDAVLARPGGADRHDRARRGLRDDRRRRGRHRRGAARVRRPRRPAVQGRLQPRAARVRGARAARARRVHRLGPARIPRLGARRLRARLRHDQRRARGAALDRLHPGAASATPTTARPASRRRARG